MKHWKMIGAVMCCAAMMAACDDDSDAPETCTGAACNSGQNQQQDFIDPDDMTYCGDGFCDDNETEITCAVDCRLIKRTVCGNDKCESGETRLSCPNDCKPICGDGRCESPEIDSCAQDCGEEEPQSVCENNICEIGEDEEGEFYCPSDCAVNVELTEQQLTSLSKFHEVNETSPYHFMFDYEKAMNPTKVTTTGKLKEGVNDFFAFPFPGDLRTDNYGRPNIKDYPVPQVIIQFVIGDIIDSLIQRIQEERAGFSPLGAIYFRASAPIDPDVWNNIDFMSTTSKNSCVQLIDVENPNLPDFGRRVPVYVTFQKQGNDLWADNTLAIRPVPGAAMHPGHRHVAVVMDCMTSSGKRFVQSDKLKFILADKAPFEIKEKTTYYVDALKKLGFDLTKVHAMTGFKTMDPAKEMDQMASALKGKGKIVADSNGVAKGTWTRYYSKYAIFTGSFETCNFIQGDYSGAVPNYNASGYGDIRFDYNGILKSQCHKETVKYMITVPNTDMPENGYPIIVYGHGTGGGADTHVYSEGYSVIYGDVPAAMIGFDACLQGDRTSGEGTESELMGMLLKNPVVIRESVRQTVNDMLVLYDILDREELVLPPNPYGTDKTKNVKFDKSYGLYMGHSQGSQEGGLLLGLTSSIKSAFLSAGGGGVALAFNELKPLNMGMSGIDDLTISDLVALALGEPFGSLSYDTFITNHIVQPLLDPIDPLNFAHRFIKDPPYGMNAKNIAQTMGLDDQCTPMVTQMALAMGIGLPLVGNIYTTSDAMKVAGCTEAGPAEVSENITNDNGETVTGGYMQFKYTGGHNPHFIIYYMDAGERTFVDFFKSIVVDKQPKVSVNPEGQYGDS